VKDVVNEVKGKAQKIAVDKVFFERLLKLVKIIMPGLSSKVPFTLLSSFLLFFFSSTLFYSFFFAFLTFFFFFFLCFSLVFFFLLLLLLFVVLGVLAGCVALLVLGVQDGDQRVCRLTGWQDRWTPGLWLHFLFFLSFFFHFSFIFGSSKQTISNHRQVNKNGKEFLKGITWWMTIAVPATYTNSMVTFLPQSASPFLLFLEVIFELLLLAILFPPRSITPRANCRLPLGRA